MSGRLASLFRSNSMFSNTCYKFLLCFYLLRIYNQCHSTYIGQARTNSCLLVYFTNEIVGTRLRISFAPLEFVEVGRMVPRPRQAN